MCSHLLGDVQDVCDRIAILYGGELKVLGRVDELLKEQDTTQILSSKLSDAAIQEIESVLIKHGASMQKIDHPTANLEDLFLKTVQESRERPGRRFTVDDQPKPTAPPAKVK
jgi:ABC-2 type transport system ATP-binding protein